MRAWATLGIKKRATRQSQRKISKSPCMRNWILSTHVATSQTPQAAPSSTIPHSHNTFLRCPFNQRFPIPPASVAASQLLIQAIKPFPVSTHLPCPPLEVFCNPARVSPVPHIRPLPRCGAQSGWPDDGRSENGTVAETMVPRLLKFLAFRGSEVRERTGCTRRIVDNTRHPVVLAAGAY